MRTTLLAAIIFIFISGMASAATLWAIDMGDDWANGNSYLVDTSPFACTALAYPTGGLMTVQDGAYDASTSTLYLSGGLSTDHGWWEQNNIAMYTGDPGNMTLVSYSSEGMGNVISGYHWLAGIEYFGGSLYAVGYMDAGSADDGVFLIRIDNPGTASQTVTQVGDYLGTVATMGISRALCSDGSGGFIAAFDDYAYMNLYRIDPATGSASLLHSYNQSDTGVNFDALEYVDGVLYGLLVNGALYTIDQVTYEATQIGDIPSEGWTALVAVPEPGTVVLILGGVAGLMVRRRMR